MGFTSFSVSFLLSSTAIIAGTKVNERTKAEASASIIVIAMGENVLPSTPVKVSSGAKTRKMMA